MSEPAAASPSTFEAQARIGADHPCLPGHFPGRPIVPAVVLLDLAADALLQRLPRTRVRAILTAKFTAPVLPEQTLDLHFELRRVETHLRARFQGRVAGQPALQGEFELAGPGA